MFITITKQDLLTNQSLFQYIQRDPYALAQFIESLKLEAAPEDIVKLINIINTLTPIQLNSIFETKEYDPWCVSFKEVFMASLDMKDYPKVVAAFNKRVLQLKPKAPTTKIKSLPKQHSSIADEHNDCYTLEDIILLNELM